MLLILIQKAGVAYNEHSKNMEKNIMFVHLPLTGAQRFGGRTGTLADTPSPIKCPGTLF
jgi:hypothetical protein